MTSLRNLIDPVGCTVNWDNIWAIPEFEILKDTHQNQMWHKEDTVMRHTLAATNAMCDFAREIPNINKRTVMIASALFHDIGKGVTTKWDEAKGAWISPNHSNVGEKITRSLLWDEDMKTREDICSLIRNHMKVFYVYEKSNFIREIAKITEDCDMEDLLLLKKCDCIGSIPSVKEDWEEKIRRFRNDAISSSCTCGYNANDGYTKYIHYNYCDDDTTQTTDDHGKFTIYIMVGLPGSGKDTYIEKNFEDIPVVCRDDIRIAMGIRGEKPMGDKAQERQVTEIQNAMIIKYAQEGQSFVVNNTNLRLSYRNNIKNITRQYKPQIVMVYIEAPTFQDNIERRKGMISPSVIEKMRNNFDFPRRYEACSLIIEKQALIQDDCK